MGCSGSSLCKLFRVDILLVGVTQVVGVGLVLAGSYRGKRILVRDDVSDGDAETPAFTWSVAPATMGHGGLGLSWVVNTP